MQIDPEAYYRKYAPLVLRRCRRLLKHEAEALDAMQDTFVLLLRNQHTLRHEAPSSLLYRMATNVCLNKIRDRKTPQENSEEILEQIASSVEMESRYFLGRALERVFRSEPNSTSVIATLHYVDGMTLEEVAQETGLSVSGIRKRLRKLKLTAKGVAL